MVEEAAISDPPKPHITEHSPPPPSSSSSSSTATPKAIPEKYSNGSPSTRRPKSRHVSSRYLSPSPSASTDTAAATAATTLTRSVSSGSSSRRFASPLRSQSSNSAPLASTTPKRSQSVDRRRPASPKPVSPIPQGNAGGVVSAAAKLLINSKRSLSASFQGESFSVSLNKSKEASARKATPERRKATPTRDRDREREHSENSKPVDQHRWPARTRLVNSVSNAKSLTRSLDCSSGADVRKKLSGSGSGNVLKAMQQSMSVESGRMPFDGRLSLDLGNEDTMLAKMSDGNSISDSSAIPCDGNSETDSVSYGGNLGAQEGNVGGIGKTRNGLRGIVVSARFWQETNSRLRRLQDPSSPLLTSPGSKTAASNKFGQSKRLSTDSPSRTMSSPIKSATRPASPSKLWTSSSWSPSKGMSGPSVVRPGSGNLSSASFSTSSFLSFFMDVRRWKAGEDRVLDAHMLRLLHNRYLQWRFVNARADATFVVQRRNAEKTIWNAWLIISELQHSVTLKRMKLLLLRQKLKLTSILRGQIPYLEDWSLLERDQINYLHGATEALTASTLRLPVVGKAIQADIPNLKDAMGSAVDVMQAMACSICSLLSKMEEMNSLLVELVNVTAKEQLSLEQCRDFLSTLSAMQVKDCSLRTHILQKIHLQLQTI